ncbi:trehalase-like [Diorhabda sublineata]|uniref:trehalase-like n=1 Tax=Diorhabda sublineata TaxID=1163346 RepID=UPI0024E1202E|nr:trehalase-like [Diorhabda sublineata]XP_056648773.1 trehalase-like [Diorhabda sublineata]
MSSFDMTYYMVLTTTILFNYVYTETVQSCDSLIYCQGKLLETVQSARIFSDSKSFVDMGQRQCPEETLKNFKKFMAHHDDTPTSEDVAKFVKDNFIEGKELVDWIPPDFVKNPSFLENIEDLKVRAFAQSLVSIWPDLARKVDESVNKNQDKHSLIYLPNGFMIPGGRFKEIYYWDTYWIIKGLLLSEMNETVKGILDNFLSLVNRYGFVPNGSRVYYLNRSQPPLLSLMVSLYIDATEDIDWLRKNIHTLEKELVWFLKHRTIIVNNHRMARYACQSGTPRPESYYEDILTCQSIKNHQKEQCYKNIKSAAESGWDFSSRWFFNGYNHSHSELSDTDTFRIIPVDLNSFLCKAFKEISRFFSLLKNKNKSQEWSDKADKLQMGIQKLLYSEEDGVWYDYDIKSGKHRKMFYPSNLTPLWTGDFNKTSETGKKVVQYLKENQIDDFKGGIPTSLTQTGEQWDLPNAWPPLQEIVILGLKNIEDPTASDMAKDLAARFVGSCMLGYEKSKVVYEKYDSTTPGTTGGGGEYNPQTGFGWTNGVLLSLIDTFYKLLKT